jgi:hypothetical protein
MAVDLDVPQLLEMYSAGLELIYNHYCEEEEGLDAQAFMQLLTDCNIVPDPSLPEPSGKTPGSCRLGAVSAASVNKIFRSGVRNRSDQMLVRRLKNMGYSTCRGEQAMHDPFRQIAGIMSKFSSASRSSAL